MSELAALGRGSAAVWKWRWVLFFSRDSQFPHILGSLTTNLMFLFKPLSKQAAFLHTKPIVNGHTYCHLYIIREPRKTLFDRRLNRVIFASEETAFSGKQWKDAFYCRGVCITSCWVSSRHLSKDNLSKVSFPPVWRWSSVHSLFVKSLECAF